MYLFDNRVRFELIQAVEKQRIENNYNIACNSDEMFSGAFRAVSLIRYGNSDKQSPQELLGYCDMFLYFLFTHALKLKGHNPHSGIFCKNLSVFFNKAPEKAIPYLAPGSSTEIAHFLYVIR